MLPLIGAGIGLIGAIGGLFGNKKANKRLDALLQQDPRYKANPIANQRLGLAEQLLNARSPGAASAQRSIYGSQANALGQINRGATDASQALSLASTVQSGTDQAFSNLGQQENENFQQRYGNLVGAQEGVIQEGDKVYQDQVRRFEDLAKIRGAQNQNSQSTWNTISNAGMGLLNFGLASRQ